MLQRTTGGIGMDEWMKLLLYFDFITRGRWYRDNRTVDIVEVLLSPTCTEKCSQYSNKGPQANTYYMILSSV